MKIFIPQKGKIAFQKTQERGSESPLYDMDIVCFLAILFLQLKRMKHLKITPDTFVRIDFWLDGRFPYNHYSGSEKVMVDLFERNIFPELLS